MAKSEKEVWNAEEIFSRMGNEDTDGFAQKRFVELDPLIEEIEEIKDEIGWVFGKPYVPWGKLGVLQAILQYKRNQRDYENK